MKLTKSELHRLIALMRSTECPTIVNLNGADYRLVAAYDRENPAVVGLRVSGNLPNTTRLTLMTANRFGVPTPAMTPDICHPLSIHDLANMVLLGPDNSKAGYCMTASELFLSVWGHRLQPELAELQDFFRQTANTGAILKVYDGATCFQSTWWSCRPQLGTAMDRLLPVMVSHLVARDEATAQAARLSAMQSADVLLLTSPASYMLAAA
jgi:hypothetical protein